MPRYDFDMFTIGAGSGGVASSRRAGSYGARVAICARNKARGGPQHQVVARAPVRARGERVS